MNDISLEKTWTRKLIGCWKLSGRRSCKHSRPLGSWSSVPVSAILRQLSNPASERGQLPNFKFVTSWYEAIFWAGWRRKSKFASEGVILPCYHSCLKSQQHFGWYTARKIFSTKTIANLIYFQGVGAMGKFWDVAQNRNLHSCPALPTCAGWLWCLQIVMTHCQLM